MSAGLFLKSGVTEDQLSARKVGEADEMLCFVSAVVMEKVVGGATPGTLSCFCFFGFCSCWFPVRKLPTTT